MRDLRLGCRFNLSRRRGGDVGAAIEFEPQPGTYAREAVSEITPLCELLLWNHCNETPNSIVAVKLPAYLLKRTRQLLGVATMQVFDAHGTEVFRLVPDLRIDCGEFRWRRI
jgi:hypothetical protein